MKKYALSFWGFLFCFAAVLSAQDENSILSSSDESYLIGVIEKPGNEPNDIHLKNLACKRLVTVGTENAIPALTAMLSDEKLNHSARTALEAIPGEAVDQALIDSLSNLDGINLVGVIDSLAMRKTAAAAAPLIGLLAATDDNAIEQAVYNALGYIATEDAVDTLLSQLAEPMPSNVKVSSALADGLLRAAAAADQAGNGEKAAQICEAVANSQLPQFDKNGGLYNELLYRHSGSVEKLVRLLSEGNDNDFKVALKTVREFSANDAGPIVSALLAVCPNLPENRQTLLIAALGDRADDASRKLVLPYALELIQNGNAALLEAAIRVSGRSGKVDPLAAYNALVSLCQSEKDVPFDTVVEAVVALPNDLGEKPAELVAGKTADEVLNLTEQQKKALLAQMKILELRRIVASSPDLLAIASIEGVDPEIRDHAVAALSEIVTLEEWNLLVQALQQEQDEQKVDWYLRAASTRLPREDCAKTVVSMYEASDKAGKEKLLALLKQIGGRTALAAAVKAASDPEMADKATEILGQWNTPEDAAPLAAACLKLAKTSPKYKTRAIRAYIRIARQFELTDEQRIQMAKVAFDTAARPEDKRLIFEIFKRMINIGSVQAALSYTDQPDFSEDACQAAVFVAEKIQGTSPELKDAMNKVLEITKDQSLKDRASKVLERQ